jgi:hypothetical protein
MKDFVPYKLALELKQLGFDEECFAIWSGIDEQNFSITDTTRLYSSEFRINGTQSSKFYVNDFNSLRVAAPTYSQAINFLYICSNKKINIELKASDSYEERVRKINKGCEDLRNLQNNKPNQ